MLRRLSTSGVVLPLLFVIAACSEALTDPPQQEPGGQFTATVTGAAIAQLGGQANSMGGASPAAWNIRLIDADGVSGILFLTDGMARPAPGSYPISSTLEHGGNAPLGEFTALVTVSGSTVFGSVSGTLTISASSADAVTGSFIFTGEDTMDLARTVTVEGTFSSSNLDI